MSNLLQYFIWISLASFVVSLIIPKRKENALSLLSMSTALIFFIGLILFIGSWIMSACPILFSKHLTLFQTEDIEIFISFYFDKTTAVFALMGSLVTFLVAKFSKTYLHRDEGYKRFFSTILLFFLSYNMLIFSGNFETLFMGWEVLGICSFLLIAFYRDRYLPVKNSLKVMSIYRLGDICLILGMWMSHHLWHENITFLKLNDTSAVLQHITEHNWYAIFIGLMIIIAAAAKSAQLPFSTWLPRAMEGPTSSSAIFYGALSVHLGVFLLIRTSPYWESILILKLLVIAIGIITSLIATSITRVQSSVKVQIAYASITQIGFIFIEIALGFHILALIHFSANAFLRTYQLIVSPSVLGYAIHDMVFSYIPKSNNKTASYLKLKNTIYQLALKEWNLDTNLTRLLWNPFKWMGNRLEFLTTKLFVGLLVVIFALGVIAYFNQLNIPVHILEYLPHIYSIIGFLLILAAFSDKGDAIHAWLSIISSQLFMTVSIAFLNEDFGHNHILIYLSGSIISAIIGYICLEKLKTTDGNIQLNQFHGYAYEYPRLSFVFLLSCLGLLGLPFTPTFIGIDILFSHIHKHEEIIIILTAISYLIIEISILRIYARLFLGQHKKTSHAIAYRSS